MFSDAGENATFLIISFYSEFFCERATRFIERKEGARWARRREKYLKIFMTSDFERKCVDNTWKLSGNFGGGVI